MPVTDESNGAKRFVPKIYLFALLIFQVSFMSFLVSLSPSVYWLDSGELQAALPQLGIPHSPSFPTYMITNHPSRYLPFGDMAFRANLLTAVSGSMIGVLIFIILTLLRPPKRLSEWWICFIIGLSSVFNPMIWFQNLKAEIYALNILLLLGAVICMLKILNKPEDQRLRFRCSSIGVVLLGLGLTNHSLLTVHIAPALLLFFLMVVNRYKFKEFLTYSVIFIFTLSIYIYLPIRSAGNPWMDTGNPEHWMNFVNALTRRGTYNRFFGNAVHEMLTNLKIYLDMNLTEIGHGLIILSFVGLIWYLFSNWKQGTILITAYTVNVLITVMNKNFNANPDTGPAYLMLSTLILSLGFGLFCLLVLYVMDKYLKSQSVTKVLCVAIILIPVSWVVSNRVESARKADDSAGKVARACLDICEPDSAIFFGFYHNIPFVVDYLQSVEHYRRDVIGVNRAEMVYWPGGLERFAERHPEMLQDVFASIHGNAIKYLAPRSCRHSEEIPYDRARALLFRNNTWMARAHLKRGAVYWFPSEDDELIDVPVTSHGPMLQLLGGGEQEKSMTMISEFIAGRVQLELDAGERNSKGLMVLSTYYDQQCITLSKSGRLAEARYSASKQKEFFPELVSLCDELEIYK